MPGWRRATTTFKALLRNPGLSSDTSIDGFPQSSETLQAARGAQKTFNRLDPPKHDVLRRMLTKDFSIGQIATLKPFIEGLVDRLLDQIEANGAPADLVTTLAEPLPAHVVCKIMALPPADFGFFLDRVGRWMDLNSTPDEARQAAADIADYLAEMITARKEDLGGDLVSELIQKYLIPGGLTEFELVHMLHLLVIGGFDTTANMIALGTILLLQNPDQMKDLREHPEFMQHAVEEMLRYLSVAHHVAFRLARSDIKISDICIHAGDGVITPVGAANYDPEVFPQPESFDIRRDARDHVRIRVRCAPVPGPAPGPARAPGRFHQTAPALPDVAPGGNPGRPPLQGLDDLRRRALPGQLVKAAPDPCRLA